MIGAIPSAAKVVVSRMLTRTDSIAPPGATEGSVQLKVGVGPLPEIVMLFTKSSLTAPVMLGVVVTATFPPLENVRVHGPSGTAPGGRAAAKWFDVRSEARKVSGT